MTNRYVNSVAAATVAAWQSGHVYAPAAIITQATAPGYGGFRCFRTAAGGTSGGTEPYWSVSQSAITMPDGTITDWTECTGLEAYNQPGAWNAAFDKVESSLSSCISFIATLTSTITNYAIGDYVRVNSAGAITNCHPVIKVATVDGSGKILTYTFQSYGAYLTYPGSQSCTLVALTGIGTGGSSFISSTAGTVHVAAGDNIYLSSNHAQTIGATVTITLAVATMTLPNSILSIDESGAGHSPPTSADLKKGASISSTGAFSLNTVGFGYFYGIIFNGGSGSVTNSVTVNGSAANVWERFENCAINKVGTSAGVIAIGHPTNITSTEFINTTVSFGNTGDTLNPVSRLFSWKNTATAIQGATLPTTLISGTADCYLEGVDLSALGSGKTIIAAAHSGGNVVLKDCKLGASVTPAATPSLPLATRFLLRTDSTASTIRNEKYVSSGTQTIDTTYVKSGGATDYGTAITWKIVTTSSANFSCPFETMAIAIENTNIVGNITLSIDGLWANASGNRPNEADIWIEVEFLSNASYPLGAFANDSKASILAADIQQATSAASWAGSLTNAVAFSISKQITAPALTGWIYARVMCGKASTTFYIDPTTTVS